MDLDCVRQSLMRKKEEWAFACLLSAEGPCFVLFFAKNTYLYAPIRIHSHIDVSLSSLPWFGNIPMFTFNRQ